MNRVGGAIALLATAVLASASPAACATFRSAEWGVTIGYPANLAVESRFKSNFMDRGAWRVSYAADTGPGSSIIGFTLPDIEVADDGGSGKATAELRFGASRDADVVASCLTYGLNSGNNVESRSLTIGGVTFVEVPDNSDGEMSKMIRSDDLRAVHKGVCYAIDLVLYVEGTSNRRPEFSPVQMERLKDVLGHVAFD